MKHGNTTHGMKRTRFYKIWTGMKTRCYNKNKHNYHRYGGRGIKVSVGWQGFLKFKEDMYEDYLKHCEEFGEKDTQIDRVNGDGNYELGNCKWSTREEQNNNRVDSRFITFKGERKTIAEWARVVGLNRMTIWSRLKYGWSVERALTNPIMKNGWG